MPCSPSDVSIDIPLGPSGPSIPGFGVPFSLNLPNLNPFPAGFPEDLLDLFNKLQLLIPSGALKPSLSLNFSKDIFDSILSMLDKFFPFLMMYKFFLPILNIIICIIEVLCAIPNPFKVASALIRLFTKCIPAFLLLFPIFAIIIMIISLILLLLALIEYIISQILKFILAILRNIQALSKAFQEGAGKGVLAIANKLGALLCVFQNLFVLLSIFAIIIQIIKDILAMAFSIPPCDDSDQSDAACCNSTVCPTIVKNPYTRSTGQFKYLSQVNKSNSLLPPEFAIPFRNESWQLFDLQQDQITAFINIINAFDVPVDIGNGPPYFKPNFFPTDSVYNAQTPAKQAAYTVDLKLFYNPINWGRVGTARYVRFNNCIMSAPPSISLQEGDLSSIPITNAVISLVGGIGYEDNGTTVLTGFGPDGVSPLTIQATLENFIHTPAIIADNPTVSAADGYTFSNVEYTFKPNQPILLGKTLITAGCLPDVANAKNFINIALAGDVALKTGELNLLVNSSGFPDPAAAQQCLNTALSALRSNLTNAGVAQFQATATICLQKLKDDANSALKQLVGIGVDPCKSTFTINPAVQFTSAPIEIKVDLNEANGLSLTTGINADIGANLASRIKAYPTFGNASTFAYDGYQSFMAKITSDVPGTGETMISFDNNMLCKNTTTAPLEHTLQTLSYQFIYAPAVVPTADGDQSDGSKPIRDIGGG